LVGAGVKTVLRGAGSGKDEREALELPPAACTVARSGGEKGERC
jgi:hypothetical protein